MVANKRMNYVENSGSYSAAQVLGSPFRGRKRQYMKHKFEFEKPSTTTITPGSLTVKYFQRIFDAGLSVYCYYTKTSIDATPSSGETTPPYEGEISDHSVVKILEIY